MSELGDKQRLFARLVPRLIDQAHSMGFEVQLGDVFRDPRAFGAIGEMKAYGHPSSAHKQHLAIDLNLYRDNVYLTDTEDHRQLGEWWEQQHALCRWGGRFRDGNHYSIEHEGIR